jgi:eukaryotic-like serine/threonine-protein kinase
LLWTFDFPVPVDIQLGVAVADGVVYTTTTHGEIYALSAGTGITLWQASDPAITFKTAPVVANGIVYASSSHDTQDNSNPVLYALNARTGHVLWQHPLGTGLVGFAATGGADLLFAGLNRDNTANSQGAGDLIALNAVTGQQLWQVPMAGALYEITPTAGNVVYTGTANGVLDAWQADTGNHLWGYRASGAVNSLVQINDGIAYFGCTDRRVYAVAAQP